MVKNKNQQLCDVSSHLDTWYLFQNVLKFVGDFFLKESKINHFGSVLSKQEIWKVLATVFKRNVIFWFFSWLAYLQDGLHPVSSKLFTSQKGNISCQNDKESCQEVLQNKATLTFINSTEFLMATATNNLQETVIEIVYSRVLPVALQFIQVHKLYFSQNINLWFP